MLAARLADELEHRFGAEYGDYVELLGSVRDTVKEWTGARDAQRGAIAAVLDQEAAVLAQLAAGRAQEALDLALAIARAAIATPIQGGSERP
jgi:hypothetical protein